MFEMDDTEAGRAAAEHAAAERAAEDRVAEQLQIERAFDVGRAVLSVLPDAHVDPTQTAADAALGRQVREAAAAMGVEPGKVVAELVAMRSLVEIVAHGATLLDMRANYCKPSEYAAAILARLSPAPAEGENGGAS